MAYLQINDKDDQERAMMERSEGEEALRGIFMEQSWTQALSL